MLRRSLLLLSSLTALGAGLLPATAPAAFGGADRTETYIATPDGEQLHAEVLRPKGIGDAKTPVILIASPYLGHSGGGTAANPRRPNAPSQRFADFIDGAGVFERGYSVVMVDLRGSGGSTGCLDILGPGESTDIKAGVEWAASQPWSTGRVGMYGKSYDANTGMVGAALRPKGLHAVVAQQVVPNRYLGSYMGGVRYLQSLAYPAVSYGSGAELGATLSDDPGYAINSLSRSADCQAALAPHYVGDPTSAFWTFRNWVAKAKGSTVPTLMTTGFLDANTNIGGGAVDFFNALEGDKRLWIGWWDHVRGNDTVGGTLAMGRDGWFDEVLRFYDHHLKRLPLSEAPTHRDPRVAVQGSDGRWRSETAWPPRDAEDFTAQLKPGSYADDARNRGSRDSSAGPGGAGLGLGGSQYGAGAWTISPPLPHAVHLSGIPSARVDLGVTAPATNVVVNAYDIDPQGRATMLTRGTRLVDASGSHDVALYPTEWTLPKGHRLGVLVSGANNEAWIHVPTSTTVSVRSGSITLPVLGRARNSDLAGDPAPRLETYRTTAPFPVPAAALAAPAEPGLVPPPQIGRGGERGARRAAARRKLAQALRIRAAEPPRRSAAGARRPGA